MTERRRVVNEDGKLESVNDVFDDVGGGSTFPEGDGSEGGVKSGSEVEEGNFPFRGFPMPMFAFIK